MPLLVVEPSLATSLATSSAVGTPLVARLEVLMVSAKYFRVYCVIYIDLMIYLKIYDIYLS